MGVFPDRFTERMWRAGWCDIRFQPAGAERRLHGNGDGCPISAEARSRKLPPQFGSRLVTRGIMRLRETLPGQLYTCPGYLARPPVYKAPKAKATRRQEALSDLPVRTRKSLVPVEGWPDRAASTRDRTRP